MTSCGASTRTAISSHRSAWTDPIEGPVSVDLCLRRRNPHKRGKGCGGQRSDASIRVQKRVHATIKERGSAKPGTIRFAEGRVRPPFESIPCAHPTALRRPFIECPRTPAGLERARRRRRVEHRQRPRLKFPRVRTPRAPLDRTSCRCAGPLARLGACHTLDSRSPGSANPDGANAGDQSRAPARRRSRTSSTTSEVEASPPRSKVRIPSAAAPSVARRMAAAASATAASPRAA